MFIWVSLGIGDRNSHTILFKGEKGKSICRKCNPCKQSTVIQHHSFVFKLGDFYGIINPLTYKSVPRGLGAWKDTASTDLKKIGSTTDGQVTPTPFVLLISTIFWTFNFLYTKLMWGGQALSEDDSALTCRGKVFWYSSDDRYIKGTHRGIHIIYLRK